MRRSEGERGPPRGCASAGATDEGLGRAEGRDPPARGATPIRGRPARRGQAPDAAHAREHSLEVELPFQRVKPDARLVPLVVGRAVRARAQVLRGVASAAREAHRDPDARPDRTWLERTAHDFYTGAGTAGTLLANKLVRTLPEAEWRVTVVDKTSTSTSPISCSCRSAGIEPTRSCGIGRVTSMGASSSRCPRPPPSLGRALEGFERGRIIVNIVDLPIKCPVAPLAFAFLADSWLRKRGIRDEVELVYATPLEGAFTKPRASAALGGMLESRGIQVLGDFSLAEVDGTRRVMKATRSSSGALRTPWASTSKAQKVPRKNVRRRSRRATTARSPRALALGADQTPRTSRPPASATAKATARRRPDPVPTTTGATTQQPPPRARAAAPQGRRRHVRASPHSPVSVSRSPSAHAHTSVKPGCGGVQREGEGTVVRGARRS